MPPFDENDKTGPLFPVGMVNHGGNFLYNRTKWGVDKGTESFLKISGNEKISLEAKYVLRLFDGVVGNGWHVELGRTVVIPFVKKYKEKNDGKIPSIESIRKKCESLTLDDFVFQASIEWLKQIERERNGDIRAYFGIAPGVATPPRIRASRTASVNASDDVRSMLMEQRQKDWPVTRNRVKRFSEGVLRKIRLHVNVGVQHNIMRISQPKTCALCYSSKNVQRKVTTKCSICEVTLCTMPRPPSNTSCWEAWHSSNNLVAEAKARADALALQRLEEKESNQERHRARVTKIRNARRTRAADNVGVDAVVRNVVGEGSVSGGGNNNESAVSGIEDGVASLAIQNNIIAENESNRSSSSSPRRKQRRFFGVFGV